MATTAPKGDDRSEKRRRPFGKATTVYETEICLGDPSGDPVNSLRPYQTLKPVAIDRIVLSTAESTALMTASRQNIVVTAYIDPPIGSACAWPPVSNAAAVRACRPD
ncbi:hypothetical protein Bbelb_111930 [Branchiostoma belcheri]|nr:hypothetical protein Bbelb_111930 [Branchiostoma belcheri]